MATHQNSFIVNWHIYTLYAAYVFFGIGIIITVGYYLKLFFLKGKSKKYDFINKNQARFLWYSILSIIVGLGLLMNSLFESVLYLGNIFQFSIEIIMTSLVTAVIGYSIYAFLKYYYPSILEKKLNKIRFSPHVSSKSGNKMRLLTEDEEDIHLTAQMILDEESNIYEYDVWMDEETGDKIIEKYDGHLHAIICPKCNFRTLKVIKENILKSPTFDQEGLLEKHYTCTYCGHNEETEAKIASLNG